MIGSFFRVLAEAPATPPYRSEDLHWSDTASLDALRFLARNLTGTTLVLLAVTYRDDELTRRHELFQLLPVLVRETGASRVDVTRQPITQRSMRSSVISVR